MYRLLLPSGRIKWFWDLGECVDDEEGCPQYLEGLIMDVSEQKFQELALREENRALRESVVNLRGLGSMVGQSEPMRQLYSQILRAAETDQTSSFTAQKRCGKDL